MKKTLITVSLLLSSTLAFAQNDVVGLGAGTTSCKSFIDLVKSGKGLEKESTMLMFDSWMTGYVSGRNAQLNALNYDYVDLGKSRNLGNKLTQACETEIKNGNGKILIMIVAMRMFDEMYAADIKKSK